jgi:autotransporter passenger strand-loop-strand repeat protein
MADTVISGGQTSTGITVFADDTLTVLSGGTASAATIRSAGIETISAGGLDVGAIVSSGGQQVVASGGATSGDVIGFQGGAFVYGTAGAITVSSGGSVGIESGGTLVNAIDLGEIGINQGAVASNTLVSGLENVGGAEVSATVFGSLGVGGTGAVLSGGVVSSGGRAEVRPSGLAVGIVVVSGGNLQVDAGNLAFQLSGGTASGSVLIGGSETVFGTDVGATIKEGAVQEIGSVDEQGFAISAVVDDGGTQFVNGVASNTTVNSGGFQAIFFGRANGTVLSGGSQVVSADSTAEETTIFAGGTQLVSGVAAQTTILAGGMQSVTDGEALATSLSGGTQFVFANGAAFETTIFAGGSEILASGGTGSLTVLSGGQELVSGGGIAGQTIVLSRGNLFVSYGGTAGNTMVMNAGSETVASGGVIGDTALGPSGDTTIVGAGALVDLQAGAVVAQDLAFIQPGGRLEIDDTASPGFTISGFAPDDTIDLANLPFDSSDSATLLTGNVLQVAGSGGTVDLQLDPNHNFLGHTFMLAPDAGSGTSVSEPTGGRFLFGPAPGSGLSGVSLGINNAVNPIVGAPVSGNLNIEVFTSKTIDSTLPGLDAGYQQGIIDNGGYIASNPAGYLTGAALQLFGGDYLIVDAAAGGNTPALILLGSGNQTVAGAAGDTLVGGSGPATMYGVAGDSIAFGSVGQYADGTRGDIVIAVGAVGVDSVVGSTVAGSGDTITGGAAALSYNVGAGGDLLNLAGATGAATINAFSTGGNDTIIAGNGATSVWGGGGDRIAVGGGPMVGGTDLWGHSTTVPGAAIGFGTNDAVVATTYDTIGGTFSVNSALPGASSAQVTVGGGAGNFDTAHDFLFYPNESPLTDAVIVATAQSADGGASSVIALPDGTLMTLTGVTTGQLATALGGGTLFRA